MILLVGIKMKYKTTAVIMSRNDNYGGFLKERATIALSYMINTFDEVVYVDYNSEGKPLIDEIKDFLPLEGNLTQITVTPEQHKKFIKDYPDAPNCIEVFGRNIGIRRAKGDIIISTNIDIIPPNKEIMRTFFNTWYEENTFYTCSRRNVRLNPFDLTKYKFDENLRTDLLKNIRKMTLKGDANGRHKWSRIMCCGDFQIAHKDIWNKVKGFEESLVYRFGSDTQIQMKAELSGTPVRGLFDLPIFHIDHGYDKILDSKFNRETEEKHSENKETWGFAKEKFKTEIL